MSLTLPALPYAIDALEPHVSRRTLAAHHGRHHARYVATTVDLVRGTPLESASLATIVRHSAELPDRRLFNAAAQAWNHEFYWHSLQPGGGGAPHGAIAPLIEDAFRSHEGYATEFAVAAARHFGSGWTWLVLEGSRMRIMTTANADTPLIQGCVPLLALDLWEHAYYLDYEHARSDYIETFLGRLANWQFANRNLALALPRVSQSMVRRRSVAAPP